MLMLFALGACGNINHRDITWADNQKGVQESFRIATSLAGAINRSWSKLQPFDATKIQVRSEIVKLPTAPISDEDIAKANDVLKRLTDPKTTFTQQVSAYPEGQYEVISARCAAGSGEMLVTAALKLLTELHD